MRNVNITKMDSKGRILIPSHIREILDIEEGTEIIIIPNSEKSEARLLPLTKNNTAEIKIRMTDSPGSLAGIAKMLEKHKISILMSKTRSIVKGKVAEWDMIVDISNSSKQLDKIKSSFLGSGFIKHMEIKSPQL
ncbi:MAG: ACT domain-containing protein [Candidatus Aenigmatarchaeota archaeon]